MVKRVPDNLSQATPLYLEAAMTPCACCGNTYDKAFTVTLHDGTSHVFDSFECAIQLCAPICGHCSCRVIGHGVEADDRIFCCVHCARHHGVKGLEDRV